ncbi:hypothetical protein EV175_000204 [Coemansia sp. RSA 1933]|nr:hypothetical protein EV175_000204 [Coemansia sp. RSA 1933]
MLITSHLELRKEQAERNKEQAEFNARILQLLSQQTAHDRPAAAVVPPSASVLVPKAEKYDSAWYIKLSKSYDRFNADGDIPDALEAISEDWAKEWDEAAKKATSEDVPADIANVLARYRELCKNNAPELNHMNCSEKTYQTAFENLARAVDEHAPRNGHRDTNLYWKDTHKSRIGGSSKQGRYPDGIFSIKPTTNVMWSDVFTVVEIKGSKEPSLSHLLRGQILQNFIDMAESRPRRFAFGISLGCEGEMHLFVCLPDSIHIAWIGILPLLDSTTNKALANERLVVAFFLFMYKQIAKDCGFLTRKSVGLHSEFTLGEIVGISPDEKSGRLTAATKIRLSTGDENKVLGRHKGLQRSRTWIYPKCTFGDGKEQAVFKFQWVPDGSDLESTIHRTVWSRGVPHVPKLIYAAKVVKDQKEKSEAGELPPIGEVLIVEDVGSSVETAFGGSEAKVIDIFAAYAHTLIAAAKIEGGQFILHRDISMGNLMVTPEDQPYVIDWGCGCVCSVKDGNRTPSGKVIVGTAIYMGIRILCECKSRSVVDDLESLFLVFCHCIWKKYGDTGCESYTALWNTNTLYTVRSARSDWLGSRKTLFDCMGIKDSNLNKLPKPYRRLAEGMYDILFPSWSSISSIKESDSNDPRFDAYKPSEWLKAFDKAVGDIKGPVSALPNVAELRTYVRNNKNRRTSFIIDNAPISTVFANIDSSDEIGNNQIEDDLFTIPADEWRGTKRGSTSQISSPKTKISRN